MKQWCDDSAAVISVISGKWSIPVLSALEEGSLRHNDLHRSVGNGIHSAVLDSTLRRLESAGLVSRHADAGTPPATWYGLTALARSLIQNLAPLSRWAEEHRAELERLPTWFPPARPRDVHS